MPKLNLEAKNETQKIIKDYLEKNVSDMLAEKINNGVRIHKDGKTLINKKTLEECMEFAIKEAQKLTEKGARAACIQDSVVFGWAIHYFEEDSIEGTLYNEDGTEYKPPKPVTPPKPATAYTPPKPQPKPQMSLFELMENNANEEKPSENAQGVSQIAEQPNNPALNEEPCDDAETEEKPAEEELREAAEAEEELREAAEAEEELPLPAMPTKAVQMQGSPFYQRYMRIQDKYPEHIVLFSRGDFYEALGKGAQILSENLALTLTGRDCGFSERVPMVGVPHHAVDNYIGKAIECGLKIVLADSSDNVKEYPQRSAVAKTEEPPVRDDPPAEDGKHWIDDTTYVDDDGEVHTVEEETDGEDDSPAFDMSAYDAEALAKLDEIFGNLLELR